MKNIFGVITVFAVLNFCGQPVSAEVENFHTETVYYAEKGEPIIDAQDKAFKNAIRNISEEASIFVESLSQMKDNQLTSDRLETFTAAIVRVKTKRFNKELTNNGDLIITVTVDAELDTDNVTELLNELREARNSTNNYEEVLKLYTERKKNFDTIYGEYIGSYQKRILHTIRDGCKLQNEGRLDEALKFYDAAIEESVANNAELSLAYIKRATNFVMMNNLDAAAKDFERALELDNDKVGIRLIKAFGLEGKGDPSRAAQEYRAFVKEADIIYYDVEITLALDRLVELEEVT